MPDRAATVPGVNDRYAPLLAAIREVEAQVEVAADHFWTEGPTSEREAVQLGEHVVPAALQVALRAAELEHSVPEQDPAEQDARRFVAHLSALSRMADMVAGELVAEPGRQPVGWTEGHLTSAVALIALALQELPVREGSDG